MDKSTLRYFETLKDLVRNCLDKITFERCNCSPDRSIVEIHGRLKKYDVRLKEIFTKSERMYSYYALDSGRVCVGFDNYPDRRALRLKYGQNFAKHLSELIPHKHGENKITLELTKIMDADKFLSHLTKILPQKG